MAGSPPAETIASFDQTRDSSMNDPFRHLHMAPELACQFFAVFSRMEYALKATPRYARDLTSRVEADWDLFARDIQAAFLAKEDQTVGEARSYLLKSPPKKQVLRNGALDFIDTPFDPAQGEVERLLILVRRVRNNLFHGGKHYPQGEQEAGRNALLVGHSLTVLEHCLAVHDDVRLRFDY
jgi:hypothetical protein